jgi:hypothetical protein
MPDERIPKQLLYGELCKGKRPVGGQKKKFKDSIKISLKRLCIYVHSWEALATNRPLWRGKITFDSSVAERHIINETQNKRVARKSKESRTVATNTNPHVLSVADSSRPRLDFSAISAHTRLMLELLMTEAVVIIACDERYYNYYG